MLDQRPDSDRPHASHGHHRARRHLPVSSRLTLTAGFTAALIAAGIVVGTGAVKTPLSDSAVARSPKAATLGSAAAVAEPSASSVTYAIASVPATPTHKPKASAKPTHSATPKASVTPTMAPSTTPATQQSSSDLLTPQPTAEYQTPSGENQKAWSEAILTALGAPLTSANIVSIGYWMQNEAGSPGYGIVGANNPINVSQPCCGGVPIQDDGDGVTFLQSYPTVADGVEAIAQYLNRGNYTQILADLKAGEGLSDPNLASEIGLYSGGGYTTIPDSFGESQGMPES
ncbi:MAG TPA: hypothetical protein VGM12_05490 [Trebonia sp.]|jgi:hypothetical protein